MSVDDNNIENKYYYKLEIKSDNFDLIRYILDDFSDLGIEEENNLMCIYCQDDLQNLDELLKQALSQSKYESVLIKEQNKNWIDEYKKHIKPIQIGKFYIRASWQDEKRNLENIIINPSLAFGTGHHFTTYSMLENIEKYVQENDSVLDVGTGSGILAIASVKNNAIVDCCDSDEVAVINAKENFAINNIKVNKIWKGSLNNTDIKYDVVLANIVTDVICALSIDIINSTKQNGYILLSGIMSEYENKIQKSFCHLAIISRTMSNDNQWVTLVLQKK